MKKASERKQNPVVTNNCSRHSWWFNAARSKKKEKQKNKIHSAAKGRNPEWALEDEESIP